MPKSISAEAILLAINSALRLRQSIRRAYINSFKSKSVLLPLPSFDDKPNPYTINRFFELEGARFVEEIEALKYLHRKNQVEGLSQEELAEYQEYYRSLFFIGTDEDSPEQIKEAGLYTNDLLSLLKIRQWEKDSRFASTTLQLVAGTIVEIGIDYFNQFPKSTQVLTPMGRALAGLLSALDTIPFNEEEDFKKNISHQIIPQLFTTAVETIGKLPDEWVQDEKLRRFFETSTRMVSQDLYERISPDRSADEIEEAVQWGQLILSSLIRNAGHSLFSGPRHVFERSKGEEQLIKGTGLTIMELLYAEDELKLDLKKRFTSFALDAVIQNAFIVFSTHPELLSKGDLLSFIIKKVSRALAGSPAALSQLLPEIVRLILEKTTLYPFTIWDQDKEGPKHLLLTTLQLFLNALSRSTEKGSSAFSSLQILELLETAMDGVIRHPKALKDTDMYGEGKSWTLRQDVIDLVFDSAFREANEPWSPVEKTEQLKALFSLLFKRILKKFPGDNGRELAILLLSPGDGLGGRYRPATLEEITTLLVDYLEDQAIPLSKDPALRKILAELFRLLKTHWPENDAGVVHLIRLILEQMACQTEYLLAVEEENIEYLVVLAVRVLLEEFNTDHAGTSMPKLNEGQKMQLFSLLLEEVLIRPAWITAKSGQKRLISCLIHLSFGVLQKIPAVKRTSMLTITRLLDINMRAIAFDARILDTIRLSGEKAGKTILEKLMERVFDFIFHDTASASLHKTESALELLEFMLQRVLLRYPDQLGLGIADFLLQEDARLQLSKGVNETMFDLYMDTLLDMTTTHPDIVSPNPNIRRIITGVAQSLEVSGLDRPGLLPRVLRLVLIQRADNIEFNEESSHIKETLLEALRQILDALSFEPEKGQWKPVFTGDHILEIVLYLLGEISENPEWVDEDQKVYKTLHIIFESLELIPRHQRPSFSLIKLMIIKLFEAVKNHPGYLNMVNTSERTDKIVLQLTLEHLFTAIYGQVSIKATLNIIHQPSVMDALLDYYLYRTSFHPIDEDTIQGVAAQVGEIVKKLDEGHLNSAEELLDELRDSLA